MEDARGRPYRVPWTPATAEVDGGVEDHGGTLRRQGMAAGMRTKPGKERERENARDRQKNVAGDGWGVGGRERGMRREGGPRSPEGEYKCPEVLHNHAPLAVETQRERSGDSESGPRGQRQAGGGSRPRAPVGQTLTTWTLAADDARPPARPRQASPRSSATHRRWGNGRSVGGASATRGRDRPLVDVRWGSVATRDIG